MKNLFKGVSILLLSLVVISGYAQKKAKPFQGTITYTYTFEGEIDANQKLQLPTGSILYLKGDKLRDENKSAMGSQVSIADKATQDMIMLILWLLHLMGDMYSQAPQTRLVRVDMIFGWLKLMRRGPWSGTEHTEDQNMMALTRWLRRRMGDTH